ncbi:DUF6801 domain-containing protein [Streptomyces sp. NPDC050504]|uniref:DUF6801 domain-containing protein n=1 Tax=Streptomyces sp. NPDC050504 TaxID=3365618 RepID=UPI0037AC91E6
MVAGARTRTTAKGAAVAAAVLLAGMIPGARAAEGDQRVDAELSYTCDLPPGKESVKVRVSAKLPGSAAAGQAVEPADVETELTLPGSVLAELAKTGAAALSATTRLTTEVAQNEEKAEAVWAGTVTAPSPVPAAGDLALLATGAVPSVTGQAGGDLTFTAGALSGELVPAKEDGTPVETGPVAFSCTPMPGQDLLLGTVEVTGGEEPAEPSPSPSAPGADPSRPAAEPREKGPDVLPEIKDEPGPGTGTAPPCVGDASNGRALNAYAAGYSNVTKLKGAALLPVACAQIEQGPSKIVPDEVDPLVKHLLQDSTVVLDHYGKPQLPPATATFLTFGFMPTTAKMEMTQLPPGVGEDGNPLYNIRSDMRMQLRPSVKYTTKTTITLKLSLRLYDVEVNGVPLDVGPNCRSDRPFTLELTGLADSTNPDKSNQYKLSDGGVLTGSVTVPPFSGCASGSDDLDKIFTAAISGVPGFVKQVQGRPCAPGNGSGCTPTKEPVDIPQPRR